MRLGVGRLLLAIASVAARLGGDPNAADLLAFTFLAVATITLCRSSEFRPAVRAVRY